MQIIRGIIKIMKKLAIVFLSATLLSSSALAKKDNIVATYTGGNVTSEEVMEQFKPMLERQNEYKNKSFAEFDKNMQESLVRGYITQKMLEKESENLGVRNSKEFKQKLHVVESQLLQQELVERHLKTAITDKMIDAEYNKLKEKLTGQKELKASHILVETEDMAKDIKKKLNKGSKFEALAKEYSKDEGSKGNGGELGYVIKGQLVPEFENKAFAMKKDEISDPVKTQFGWHIIKVLDSRPAKVPSKEEAMNDIKSKLSREAVELYFSKLSEKAKIELKI